jgi:hypothetical protein
MTDHVNAGLPLSRDELDDPLKFDRLLGAMKKRLEAIGRDDERDELVPYLVALSKQANRWRGQAVALRVLAEVAGPREGIDPDYFETLREQMLKSTALVAQREPPPARTEPLVDPRFA